MKKKLVLNVKVENPVSDVNVCIKESSGSKKEVFVPFSVSIGNRNIQVTEHIKTFVPGGYYDAYLVKAKGLGEDPLQEETVVLKVLKEKWRNRPRDLKNIVRDELEEYPQLKTAFSPGSIAEHFDLEIVLKQMDARFNQQSPAQSMSHGCHFVRYISEPFPVPKTAATLFPEGTKERSADDQLRAMIAQASAPEAIALALDLTWGNVGVDAKGKLVIFDPTTPNPEGDEDEKETFEILLERALESFAPRGSERWNYLLGGVYPSISYC